jgi:hypothetical protein
MTIKGQPPSDEEPRIPIGTLGEFEMRGLSLPINLAHKGAVSPMDVITLPVSTAVRIVLNLLEYWSVTENDWASVLGVTSNQVEDYKKTDASRQRRRNCSAWRIFSRFRSR